jgi:phosphoglycolate phosphatase
VTIPLLLLWDIDGTLLQRASMEHADAMRRALIDVHGALELDGHHVEAAGRTDGAIARDLLLAAGLAGPAIDARADDLVTAACTLYDELCPADLSARLAPGIADVLPRLAARPGDFRFSLVTGNFERIARLKLARAGIGDWFPEGQGAFGSDAEDRELLPPIARARAGDWPRERAGGRAARDRGRDRSLRRRGARRRGRGRGWRRGRDPDPRRLGLGSRRTAAG